MLCTVLLNHIGTQTFKCSNVTAVIHSEINLNWLDSVKSKNVYEIICDRVYPLIKTNGRNKSTDLCYQILFEGTVNDTNRMLFCI